MSAPERRNKEDAAPKRRRVLRGLILFWGLVFISAIPQTAVFLLYRVFFTGVFYPEFCFTAADKAQLTS